MTIQSVARLSQEKRYFNVKSKWTLLTKNLLSTTSGFKEGNDEPVACSDSLTMILQNFLTRFFFNYNVPSSVFSFRFRDKPCNLISDGCFDSLETITHSSVVARWKGVNIFYCNLIASNYNSIIILIRNDSGIANWIGESFLCCLTNTKVSW